MLIYFWLQGLFSSCSRAGATLQFRRAGISLQWLLLLRSTGSRACGLQYLWHMGLVALQQVDLPWIRDRAPCLLHWQVNSCPLSHPGSPTLSSYLSLVTVFVRVYFIYQYSHPAVLFFWLPFAWSVLLGHHVRLKKKEDVPSYFDVFKWNLNT